MYLSWFFIFIIGIGIIYEFDNIKKDINNLKSRISNIEDEIEERLK